MKLRTVTMVGTILNRLENFDTRAARIDNLFKRRRYALEGYKNGQELPQKPSIRILLYMGSHTTSDIAFKVHILSICVNKSYRSDRAF